MRCQPLRRIHIPTLLADVAAPVDLLYKYKVGTAADTTGHCTVPHYQPTLDFVLGITAAYGQRRVCNMN